MTAISILGRKSGRSGLDALVSANQGCLRALIQAIKANLDDVLALTLDADDLAAISALDKPGLEGCYCHPKTPWLGRSAFTGSTDHYYG